ncbi:MAG TPA: preprotein translocase subunit SecE [Candidatus Baltobacteraceae bacterium]|nr:preprotein translocase subunit SecE [Candidatus Baltobacteraceae bacterium]
MNEQKKNAVSRGATTASRQAASMRGGDFVSGVIAELKRVTWPTRDEWVSATILTVLLVVGIGLFTYVADQVFGWLFSQIHLLNV